MRFWEEKSRKGDSGAGFGAVKVLQQCVSGRFACGMVADGIMGHKSSNVRE